MIKNPDKFEMAIDNMARRMFAVAEASAHEYSEKKSDYEYVSGYLMGFITGILRTLDDDSLRYQERILLGMEERYKIKNKH